MSKIDNFRYRTPILVKIWGVTFGVDPARWGVQCAETGKVRLMTEPV